METDGQRVVPRKIVVRVPDGELLKDLEKYRLKAIELGALDAKAVTSEMVSIDDRVNAKCVYPRCAMYGTSANCPPNVMDIEQVRRVVGKYRYALFLWLMVPSEDIAGPEGVRKVAPWLRKMHKIVSKIEAEAYYDGYKLSLGFAGGPCKAAFCPGAECSALIPGQTCRHPLRARAAMEAVGIDVMDLAAKVGLDVYPIGASVAAPDVPHGMRFGIVFID
jgi:predicted metal-binding protein